MVQPLNQCTTISVKLSHMQKTNLSVRIRQIRMESADVASFELDCPRGHALPGYAAGAHINVRLPRDQIRSYSLMDPPETARYRIGVKRERQSRGGSSWFHDVARVGMVISIAAPENHFSLVEDAEYSVFVAGGIGITPLLAMIGQLNRLARRWELHYAAASRAGMPFQKLVGEYAAMGGGQVSTYFSEDKVGRMDLAGIVASVPADAHLYCCGPSSMIEDFLSASGARPAHTVHYERFAATQAAATAGGFEVELARDGRCLSVPAGKTVLDVLLDAGVNVPYSCGQGVCGTCQVKVLSGHVEHRDDFLTDAEKSADNTMLVCCSGSRSSRLVLDI